MKKLFVGLLTAVLLFLGVATLFGDNLRALFGMSADALVGNAWVTPRTPSYAALEKKGLQSFADPETPAPQRTVDARADSLSTFAIDVDTASYTYMRALVTQGARPRPQDIRVEEWVNAFDYELPEPKGAPFAVRVDGAVSPFDETKTLLRVALQGKHVKQAARKPAHLVFLVDVSGSMNSPDKLPLAQEALRFLAAQLGEDDTVALVTYAGSTEVVLPPTSAANLNAIVAGIDRLRAGGGTNMGSGMELAYRLAVHDVRPGHTSRVIVLTDGDANIGTVGHDAILHAIHDYVAEGVTLTTVGFGMGNYRGNSLEQLADKGNGQALYIDSAKAIERVFGTQLTSVLEVIAKDTKVQVAFDPDVVSSYRLLGYENREVADKDFRNDDVDAGELGAGHQVTALYEVTLTRKNAPLGKVFVRGQLPDSSEVFELDDEMKREAVSNTLREMPADFRFATAVALAADVMRGTEIKGWSLSTIAEFASDATQGNAEREEFVRLMQRASRFEPRQVAVY